MKINKRIVLFVGGFLTIPAVFLMIFLIARTMEAYGLGDENTAKAIGVVLVISLLFGVGTAIIFGDN